MPKYTEKFATPNSSTISNVYYDANTKSLFLEFHSGNHAGYRDVPRSLYDTFAFAESAGKFYNQFLRSQYKGVHVSDDFVQRQGYGHLSVVPDQHPSSKTGSSVPMVAVGRESRTTYGDTEARPHIGAESEKQSFIVRGYVLVEDTYEANSLDEAVQAFVGDYDEAVVKEVVVSFE